MTTDRMEAAMSVEAPERIWIESEGGCPYFYHEEELSDVSPPITEYVRADKLEELAAEIEALRETLAALKAENKRLRDALEEIRNRSSMGVMRSDQSSQSELEVVLADICLFVDAVLWKED